MKGGDPFEFPCDFPVKALGPNGDDFQSLILELVRRHAPEVSEDAVSVRPSSAGSYVAVTVLVRATSRGQLDAIYQELSAHERVVMAL
jgi:putative lipoic acid-binding regulatory protein